MLTASTTSAGAAIRNYDSLNPNADYGTHAVQAALDAAAGRPNATGPGQHGPEVLVVVYPNTDSSDPYNPESAYYENLIMHSPAKLQGVGPGGAYADGTDIAGTVIDGSAYQADAQSGTDWFALASSLAFDGNQNIYEGETLMVVANDGGAGQGTTRVDQFRSNFPASIDGLKIMGGRHDGFPNNRDPVTGAPNGQTATVETQGGGIYVNAQAHSLQITNDVIQGNSGAVRRWHPARHPEHRVQRRTTTSASPSTASTRTAARILRAGSASSPAPRITASITTRCVATTPPSTAAPSATSASRPAARSTTTASGSTAATTRAARSSWAASSPPIRTPCRSARARSTSPRTRMQANLSNDDGGAIRLLMVDGRRRSQTGDGPQGTIRLYDDRINILNNTIANNVSTHEGGGIALDDSTNVVVANNTLAHNITTATAMTSTGEPAPAGLSTAGNSFLLQAELDKRYGANSRPLFSKPTLFNNVFTDNRSGSWSLTRVSTASARAVTRARSTSGTSASPTTSATARATSAAASRRSITGSTQRRTTPPNMIASPTNLVGSSLNFVDDTLPGHDQRPPLARLPAIRRRSAHRSRPPDRRDGQLPPRRRRQQPGRQRQGLGSGDRWPDGHRRRPVDRHRRPDPPARTAASTSAPTSASRKAT